MRHCPAAGIIPDQQHVAKRDSPQAYVQDVPLSPEQSSGKVAQGKREAEIGNVSDL